MHTHTHSLNTSMHNVVYTYICDSHCASSHFRHLAGKQHICTVWVLEDNVTTFNYGLYHAEIEIPYASGSKSGVPWVSVCV